MNKLNFIFSKGTKYLRTILDYSRGRLRYKTLYMNLTSLCNSNCVYCEVKSLDHSKDLDTVRIKGIIKEAKAMGIAEVAFSGGEPLIYKDVWQLIDYAVDELGLSSNIVSNGLVLENLSTKQVEKLKKLSHLFVSLESHDAKKHNELRGGQDFFERTTRGIERVISMGRSIDIVSVISNRNYNELGKLIKFVKNLGADSIGLQPLHIWSNYDEVERNIDKDQYLIGLDFSRALIEEVKQAIKLSKKIGLNTNLPALVQWLEKYYAYQSNPTASKVWIKDVCHGYKCPEVFTKVFMHSDGSLLPCAMLSPRGSAKDKKLSQALKSMDELKSKIRQGDFPLECNKCSCQLAPNFVFSIMTSPVRNFSKVIRFIRDMF